MRSLRLEDPVSSSVAPTLQGRRQALADTGGRNARRHARRGARNGKDEATPTDRLARAWAWGAKKLRSKNVCAISYMDVCVEMGHWLSLTPVHMRHERLANR